LTSLQVELPLFDSATILIAAFFLPILQFELRFFTGTTTIYYCCNHFCIAQTAYATQWALYLLARNADAQEVVSKEVQNLDEGSTSVLSSAPLVRGVIRESLRLYPVAPFLTRLLPEDCEIGGYNIPAGVRIK
jgi:hypothetical protein